MASLFQSVGYAKYNHYQRFEAFKCLAKSYDLVSSLSYPAKALDVGCGTGDVTKLLTYFSNIANVVAFDKFKEMVVYADSFNSDSRIQYAVADVENISTWPTPNHAEFDLVLSFAVLHWLNDTQTAMNNIFHCLKPNGLFIARFLGRRSECEKDLIEFVRGHEKWSKYAPEHFLKPQPWMDTEDPAKAYSVYLKNAGFDDSLCTNDVVKRVVLSKDDMKEYLKISRLHRCLVPANELDEFADQCTDAWTRSAKRLEGGGFEFKVNQLDVKARKA